MFGWREKMMENFMRSGSEEVNFRQRVRERKRERIKKVTNEYFFGPYELQRAI